MTNSRPPGDQETPSQTTRKDVEGTWGITPKIVLWLPWPHMHTCIIDRQKMVKREHPTKGGAWEAALGYMHTKKDVLSWSVCCSYDHLLALFPRTISPLLPTPTFSSQHTQLRKCTWVIPKLGTSILEVAYIYKENDSPRQGNLTQKMMLETQITSKVPYLGQPVCAQAFPPANTPLLQTLMQIVPSWPLSLKYLPWGRQTPRVTPVSFYFFLCI